MAHSTEFLYGLMELYKRIHTVGDSVENARNLLREYSKHISALFVDDEKNIRNVVESNLRSVGFVIGKNLYFATDGRSGLTKYREVTPNVVISDFDMPGMDGVSMVHEIRKIHPMQRAMILSSYVRPKQIQGMFRGNHNVSVMLKPNIDLLTRGKDIIYQVSKVENILPTDFWLSFCRVCATAIYHLSQEYLAEDMIAHAKQMKEVSTNDQNKNIQIKPKY